MTTPPKTSAPCPKPANPGILLKLFRHTATGLAGLALLAVLTGRLQAADFNISTPGGQFAYLINGVDANPTLTVTRGQTYTFAVSSSSFHPFEIVNAGAAATGNNTSSGTITFQVPLSGPASYDYQCSIHGFGGTINVVNPPPPPAPVVKILSVTVNPTNVTLISSGTNAWTAVPEFSSNLLSPVLWGVVPKYTNFFSAGTNFTSFGRLEAICGPKVFLRMRNTN